ncbi:hypothetical protein [Nocardiopsis deserti]|uniref:hypothetical protein n=1 Tax=Nocardiopsis deserti TaxID=2605988 RepID=UPI0012388BD2|nr:hypothetical protein [Nocardiopsis deserti]
MTESPRTRVYQGRAGETQRRKTVPMWRDQWNDLTPLARDLHAAKEDPEAPRITENTLIRVAVDVLLEHAHLLAGETEDDIRNNLLNALNNDQ